MSSRQSRGSRHQSMSQATRYSGTVSAPLGYLGSLDTEELQVPAMSFGAIDNICCAGDEAAATVSPHMREMRQREIDVAAVGDMKAEEELEWVDIPGQQHSASTSSQEPIAEPQLPQTAESSRPQSGTSTETGNPVSSARAPLVQPQVLLSASMSRPRHRAQPPQHPSPPLFTGGVGLAGRLWDSFMGRFNTASSSSADPDVLAHSMSGTRHEAQPPQPPSPPLIAGGVGLAGRLWDSFVCKFNTAISRVRQEFTEETFDLPRVIVVGAESHGKSSLLESIVQADVFPRNYTRCTRAPIHFILRNVQQANEAAITVNNERLQSRDEIRDKVRQLMAALPGDSISDIPIKIVIKDVELPTLELVDLPGLCANPPALRQQSHALVQQYLSREDTMVLCVVPATEPSITSSEAIHMIEEAGKLKQTILALSMADRVPAPLRDEFIVKRVLRLPEEIRRLHFAGVVAVKNRDTLNPKTLEQAQASEVTFFRDQVIANLLPERQAMQLLIESNLTVPELIRQMEALFRDNIHNTWRPRALARMTAALQRKQGQIAALGTPPAELTLQYVWDTVIGRVDLEALCTAIRTHPIPVIVNTDVPRPSTMARTTYTTLHRVRNDVPAAAWGTLAWGRLSRDLETAVQDTVVQVLACTHHAPLFLAAYSAAFDNSLPLRLQRFESVRETLLQAVRAALAAVMRDCKDMMHNMVDRQLGEITLLRMGTIVDWPDLHKPVVGAIIRSLEPHFSPDCLQLPEDLELTESAQCVAERARLELQADEFRNVLEIIETIGNGQAN